MREVFLLLLFLRSTISPKQIFRLPDDILEAKQKICKFFPIIVATLQEKMSDPFSPIAIGPLQLRNRFIKAATNEGMCKKGVISKGLAQFHANMAAGGAALTSVAYCAISPDGRTFIDQARLGKDTRADFRALTDAVHNEGAAASAQLTHAGCFTFLPKTELQTGRPLSASGGFNKCGVMTKRFFKKK